MSCNIKNEDPIESTYKKRFRFSSCFYELEPVDIIVRSQWQTKSRSFAYMVYRRLFAIILQAEMYYSIYRFAETATFRHYFIYLTHWGVILNTVVGFMGATLVSMWYQNDEYQAKVLRDGKMPAVFKLYQALHNTALILSMVISIIYFLVLHEDSPLNTFNIVVHGLNSFGMFIDTLVIAYPLKLCHVVQPLLFASSYVLFTYIFYSSGGTDSQGRPYIYDILDWAQPITALTNCLMIALLMLWITIVMFWVSKFRIFVQQHVLGTECDADRDALLKFSRAQKLTRIFKQKVN